MIKEDFLHYIWQSLKFDLKNLVTTGGQKLQLIDNGYLNNDSGPDFANARIKIEEMLWVGSVEIHVYSADWYKHNHQEDLLYDNVILHVVMEENVIVKDRKEKRIPCLELKKRILKNELKKYHKLQTQKQPIPCTRQIGVVPSVYLTAAMEKGMTNRLFKKANRFRQLLKQTSNDWEHSLLIMLFRNFGVPVNADAFEKLALSTPLNLIRKERVDVTNLEALLFGQAGFLAQDFKDDYSNKLKHIYTYQKVKYEIKPATPPVWKFMRMRPRNFPTIRLAQLASLIHKHASFAGPLRHFENITSFQEFFQITLPEYWEKHYNLDKPSREIFGTLSPSFIHLMLINSIAPYFFTLGLEKNKEDFKIRAFDLLSSIPPENNKFTRQWEPLGIQASSAFESQGLMELFMCFCQEKKCLQCPVGHFLMKN